MLAMTGSMLALFLGCSYSAVPERAAERAAAPTLARTIVLPGVRGTNPKAGVPGRIDHLAYDPATSRLFVAALENGSLEVVDLEKGERIKSICGLDHPQGIAIVPTVGCAVLACGGGTVHVYDTRTLEEKTAFMLGRGADNVRYDARGDTVIISHGSTAGGALAVLENGTWKKLHEITFKSRPESFQLDPNGTRVFANLPAGVRAKNDGAVAVADRDTGRLLAEIKLEGRARNFPMVFDAAHERLFIACRKPARLIMIDTRRNAVAGEAECAEDSDDLFYDAKTSRVLVIGGGYRPDLDDAKAAPVALAPSATAPAVSSWSAGYQPASPERAPRDETGAIDVFAVDERGKLQRIASVATVPHARTGLFVPARRALYLAVPTQNGRDAEIQEYVVGE